SGEGAVDVDLRIVLGALDMHLAERASPVGAVGIAVSSVGVGIAIGAPVVSMGAAPVAVGAAVKADADTDASRGRGRDKQHQGRDQGGKQNRPIDSNACHRYSSATD